VVRIGAHRPLVVDHHAADGIGPDAQRGAEFEIDDSGLAEAQHDLFVRQAEKQAHGLDVHRSIEVPLFMVLRAPVGKREQRAANDTVRVGRHVEETRGGVFTAQRVGEDLEVGLGAPRKQFQVAVVADQVLKILVAGVGTRGAYLRKGEKGQQVGVAVERGVVETL
jgi:hypothetical protein